MKLSKKLKLKQLSDSIQNKALISMEDIGQRLKDVRNALGMTQRQMAKRLKIDQAVISRIEENAGSSSLKTLQKIVKVLGCDVAGSFVSAIPLEKIVETQAKKTAKKMLDRTFSNMAIEKQSPGKNSYEFQYKEIVKELCNNPGPELWEE